MANAQIARLEPGVNEIVICLLEANLTSGLASLIILTANGGDRLRQGFGRPTDVMPGYSMQLVKKRREKTIANNNELALAA